MRIQHIHHTPPALRRKPRACVYGKPIQFPQPSQAYILGARRRRRRACCALCAVLLLLLMLLLRCCCCCCCVVSCGEQICMCDLLFALRVYAAVLYVCNMPHDDTQRRPCDVPPCRRSSMLQQQQCFERAKSVLQSRSIYIHIHKYIYTVNAKRVRNAGIPNNAYIVHNMYGTSVECIVLSDFCMCVCIRWKTVTNLSISQQFEIVVVHLRRYIQYVVYTQRMLEAAHRLTYRQNGVVQRSGINNNHMRMHTSVHNINGCELYRMMAIAVAKTRFILDATYWNIYTVPMLSYYHFVIRWWRPTVHICCCECA